MIQDDPKTEEAGEDKNSTEAALQDAKKAIDVHHDIADVSPGDKTKKEEADAEKWRNE